jgi:hypothetical protein
MPGMRIIKEIVIRAIDGPPTLNMEGIMIFRIKPISKNGVEPGDRKKVWLSSNVGSQKSHEQTQGRQFPSGSNFFHS